MSEDKSDKEKEAKKEKSIEDNTDRIVLLDGTIEEAIANKVTKKILKINEKDRKKLKEDESYIAEPIKVIVNSYGGNIHDSSMIVGVIESSITPVHTYCYGKAMSGGLYVFSSGHVRYASKLATFMFHDMSTTIFGNVEGLPTELSYLTRTRDMYVDYISSVTDIPTYMLKERIKRKEDWYITADEAFQLGLVDRFAHFKIRESRNSK